MLHSDIQNQLDILDNKKNQLLIEVNSLVLLKKSKYGSVDIETPMSIDEKELNHQIASLFSEINGVIREKNKLKKLKLF